MVELVRLDLLHAIGQQIGPGNPVERDDHQDQCAEGDQESFTHCG